MDAIIDLHQAIPRFLLRCEHEVARKVYRTGIGRFLAWLDKPERGVLERYVVHMRERGIREDTVWWRANLAAEFLRYAHERGLLVEDLAEGFELPLPGRSR